MKKLMYAFLLLPALVHAQEYQEHLVIQNVMLTVEKGHIEAFEKGVAAHNKKFHAEGPYQSSVFSISSGKNAGKYIWNMGPLPWSAMDGRPGKENGHDADWDANVVPHLTAEVDVNYWRFHPNFSDFSKDFTLKNLSVYMIDIKRSKQMDFMNKVIQKVHQVYSEKLPGQRRGVYTNELGNKDGLDFAWVDFFDSLSWMGQEDKFPQQFEEVHGTGSFTSFLADVEATTDGQWTELWAFRKDLSGTSGLVEAATRQ
ncbi:MAG TPA: hypothetical protein VKN36_11385 [Eudoraea sp.]|nr:hypothetical protein [Eudoraea sp.]